MSFNDPKNQGTLRRNNLLYLRDQKVNPEVLDDP